MTSSDKVLRGFTFRERLAPSLLVALALPFTLLVFGPVDLFAANASEFAFGLWDFLGLSLLWATLAAVLLCALLLPLRGRAFDIVWACLVALTVLLFLQGNYLNGDLSSLSGDGTAEPISTGALFLNAVVWLCVLVGVLLTVLLLRSEGAREILRLIGIVAMVTVLGMQSASLAVSALNGSFSEDDSPTLKSDVQSYLTYQGMNTVSEDGNVIVFVVDRFDRRYMEEALASEPTLFDELDGFTYFDDATSLYPRTYPSVPYLATGVEADFSLSREEYLTQAYETSPFLHRLAQNGYQIRLYTDSYTAYESASAMSDYVQNASVAVSYVHTPWRLSLDMLRLSCYRYLPTALKGCVGALSTSDFDRNVRYEIQGAEKYTSDMKNAYTYLSGHELTSEENKKSFSLIHVAGTHLPNAYDRDFQKIDENHPEYRDTMSAMAQSFAIINRYLSELKALGLYEDATIVITGDHASIGSDSAVPLKYSHLTTLLVKPKGRCSEGLERSHAPVSHEDLFATILSSEGISSEGFGRSAFEILEDEVRERRYFFQRYQKSSGRVTYEQVEFSIVGKASDYGNWRIVSREDLGKSIYD